MVRVQEIAMADDQIHHGIAPSATLDFGKRGQVRRIPAKDVEDVPAIVKAVGGWLFES